MDRVFSMCHYGLAVMQAAVDKGNTTVAEANADDDFEPEVVATLAFTTVVLPLSTAVTSLPASDVCGFSLSLNRAKDNFNATTSTLKKGVDGDSVDIVNGMVSAEAETTRIRCMNCTVFLSEIMFERRTNSSKRRECMFCYSKETEEVICPIKGCGLHLHKRKLKRQKCSSGEYQVMP
jgi:hypothetical protein